MHDQVEPQHVVLHVQCHQPAFHLVLEPDARYQIEPQAIFVKQVKRHNVTGELEGQQPWHQTRCPRLCSRVKLQD